MLQHLSVLLVVRGPKTEHSTRGAASPMLSTGTWSPPCSCWPHCSWSKPGCCWPSWPPGHTAGSCSASCQPAPQDLFPLSSFPATLPQACSVAWGSCDPSAGPGIWPCWNSYSWPHPVDPVLFIKLSQWLTQGVWETPHPALYLFRVSFPSNGHGLGFCRRGQPVLLARGGLLHFIAMLQATDHRPCHCSEASCCGPRWDLSPWEEKPAWEGRPAPLPTATFYQMAW